MKKGIIIQSRIESQRLPAKAFKHIAGKTLTEIILLRYLKTNIFDILVLAVPECDVKEYRKRLPSHILNNIIIYGGTSFDVLMRYYYAAKKFSMDIITRATGDNPFSSTKYTKQALERLTSERLDYIGMKKLPTGTGTESFTFQALKKSFENSKEKYQREHVTPYIREHPELFSIAYLNGPLKDNEKIRVTIDTNVDLSLAIKLTDIIGKEPEEINVNDIINLYKKDAKLFKINEKVIQKDPKSIDLRF